MGANFRTFKRVLVGFLAETIMFVGVTLGLFMVWETWFTDVLVRADQEQAIEDIRQQFDAPPTQVASVDLERRDDPPPYAGGQEIADLMGTMYFPTLDDTPRALVNGSDISLLDKGFLGRYETTALPGEIGNFGLSGHRRTYGATLLGVTDLEAGDPIVVELENHYLVYNVVSFEIVTPDRSDVLDPIPAALADRGEGRYMTITTCSTVDGGSYGSSHRYIVYSELDHWVDKADGYPEALEGII